MEEQVQLRTYTVADLKAWLIHNQPTDGLSAEVIAPARAYAIAHNPYVWDDAKVVCALFVNEQVAAYTAAFPEILQKPEGYLAWWFSTLWCNSAFEGRGYGLIVVGTLAEEYGIEHCFDAEGASETVEILSMLGLKTEFSTKYVFEEKEIKTYSLKGKLAFGVDWVRKCARYPKVELIRKQLSRMDFSLMYSKYVDDEAYSFMSSHSLETVSRSRETMNWILHYPFMQESPLVERVSKENQFSSTIESYHSSLMKVFSRGKLVGLSFFVLSRGCSLSIKGLYYDVMCKDIVFAVLLEHALRFSVRSFVTGDKELAEFMQSKCIFSKFRLQPYSFSFPENVGFENNIVSVGIGDMFI